MLATEQNYRIAARLQQLLAEEHCTVRQAEDIFYYVMGLIRYSSTVQPPEDVSPQPARPLEDQ